MASKHDPNDLEGLDDLDDVLDEFNDHPTPAPASNSTPSNDASTSKKATVTEENPPKPKESKNPHDEDDLFERDLAAQFAKGMEELIAGLDHPQTPQAGAAGAEPTSKEAHDATGSKEPDLSQAEQTELMKQFERMLFSGTGLEESSAPSADQQQSRDTAAPQPGTTPSKSGNFQDSIAATMDRLKTSDKNAKSSTAPGGGVPGQEDLLKILSALGGEGGEGGAPSMDELLKSLGDLGGEAGNNEGLAQMLETMMSDLMGKEVLYGPMKEMNDQYPTYMQSDKFKALPQADKDRYSKQAGVVKQIVETFDDPGWEEPPADVTDEERPPASPAQQARQKKVQDLMNAMQECGAPPDEIVGDVPEGLDNIPGLGGKDEDCTIM